MSDVQVLDCGRCVKIEQRELISNGWATVGAINTNITLDESEVRMVIEELSKWLEERKNGTTE